jgi:DNA-binding SARP family transcriptional activator
MRGEGGAVLRNAAAFIDESAQVRACIEPWCNSFDPRLSRLLIVAASNSVLHSVLAPWPGMPAVQIESPLDLGLLAKPFSLQRFEGLLAQCLSRQADGASPGRIGVVVDMDWVLLSPAAHANVSVWGATAQRLASDLATGLLCLYHRRHLPERTLLAGLHAHTAIVAADGCHTNPYHLPGEIAASVAVRPRLDHWLARISPCHGTGDGGGADALGASVRLLSGTEAAADVSRSERSRPDTGERWKVRCFGSLRVYRDDGHPVAWHGAAGATRKVRCLFALLLLRGSQGASAQELIDLLWPDAAGTPRGSNRLHHSMNALRNSLAPVEAPGDTNTPTPRKGTKARDHPYLRRVDERYILTPPANTWIDVEDFEQLCRQGATLLRGGSLQEALLCLESALELYSGDLFDDLPVAFTESKDPDWCWSRRYWFREMHLKVHRDCATAQRLLGHSLQAIEHCQAALRRDPACEMAHSELLRVFASQGRGEAMTRQYRLYRLAAVEAGGPASDGTVRELYQSLRGVLRAGKP